MKDHLSILQGLAVASHEKSVDKLPYVEFAINSSVSDSTGKTPFEVCYRSNAWSFTDHLDGVHYEEYF